MQRLRLALEKRERKAKKRVATRVPKRAKEQRLSGKRILSEKKRLRTTLE